MGAFNQITDVHLPLESASHQQKRTVRILCGIFPTLNDWFIAELRYISQVPGFVSHNRPFGVTRIASFSICLGSVITSQSQL